MVGFMWNNREIPSGKLTVCYWTWLFIVDLPIKNGGSFHCFLYVYQEGITIISSTNITFWVKLNQQTTRDFRDLTQPLEGLVPDGFQHGVLHLYQPLLHCTVGCHRVHVVRHRYQLLAWRVASQAEVIGNISENPWEIPGYNGRRNAETCWVFKMF